VTIAASVPDTALYSDKAVLNLSSVKVNGVNAAGESGVDVAAYLGDVLGTGLANATDASLVDQVGSGAGTGFSAFKDLDPSIIAGVDGGAFVNATDASLINEAASGAAVPQIPTLPTLPSGMSLSFGGPDPYLYLSAVQAAPGQTVTETLYLDVTDPHGIQLTALDEAIGFDASQVQISDIQSAAGLDGLGSYATASSVDNTDGVLLAGQAFMGTGLPPVVPYGTDVAVLQFNVTVSANVSVGSVEGITLLQDGAVNGQLKFTAISDNNGALPFTAGMVPTNSGNAAIDGTVTVVPAAETISSTVVFQDPSTRLTQTRVAVSVRHVTPASQPATATVAVIPMTAVTISVPSVAIEETVVVSVSAPAPSAAEFFMTTAGTATVPLSEATATLSVAGSSAKVVDPGAALSLSAVGTNRTLPVAASSVSAKEPSTMMLDEMYRILGSLQPESSVLGYTPRSGDADSAEEVFDTWSVEDLLGDLGDQD
jgi:hypothetical protein